MATLEESPAPELNGLSREAFEAGTQIQEIFASLDMRTRLEVLPAIAQALAYELLDEQDDLSGLKNAAAALANASSQVESAAKRIGDSYREPGLRPDEY